VLDLVPPWLARIGYQAADLRFLSERSGGRFDSVDDIRGVLDSFGYLTEWQTSYRVQSVRRCLRSTQITCIDAAVLSYGLLDFFPDVKRRVLAIHRRDATGYECGHCVTLYWGPDGRVGAFSKSSYPSFGHRPPAFADEASVALSFARDYLAMGITPLYFGVTSLEEVAGALDWRFSDGDLSELSERIQQKYEYALSCESASTDGPDPASAPSNPPVPEDLE
jgi:hypothetical protein